MAQPHYVNGKFSNNSGFVTLVAVMIISAVGLSITLTLLLLGIGADRGSLTLSNAKEADALAVSCVEESLERIRKNTDYVGMVSMNIGNGVCTSTVINTGGEGREIQAVGTVAVTYTRLKIIVSAVNNNIHITAWRRVGSF